MYITIEDLIIAHGTVITFYLTHGFIHGEQNAIKYIIQCEAGDLSADYIIHHGRKIKSP